MSVFRSKLFHNDFIEAHFFDKPLFDKKPGCPDSFTWRGKSYEVREVISEWHDYRRRGKMRRNMQPKHAEVASKRGSWGVGQDFYRIRVNTDQIFDIYYDRAPKDVNHRKGSWHVYQELEEYSD